MPRFFLSLATFATLMLNGSLAAASEPAPRCTDVCTLPLAMITPPPPRPAWLIRAALWRQ